MKRDRIGNIRLPEMEDGKTWELFHESSKLSRYDIPPSNAQVRQRMAELWESLPYNGYPAVPLPAELSPLSLSLHDAIRTRVTGRDLVASRLPLRDVATLLELSYGVTRDNDSGEFPRPFRVAPSAGALYPLEIYLHSARVDGIKPGLYHYDPSQRELQRLRDGDLSRELADGLVQKELALGTSLQVFITGIFERAVFKYGDRGYRFALLEAGHVAQNMNLVANALGHGVINVGGFVDRVMDTLLGLDGITHSTIYVIAVGAKPEATR